MACSCTFPCASCEAAAAEPSIEAVQREIRELREELKRLREPQFPFPGYGIAVVTPAPYRQPCIFDNLPPGNYMISCPCPRHSAWC